MSEAAPTVYVQYEAAKELAPPDNDLLFDEDPDTHRHAIVDQEVYYTAQQLLQFANEILSRQETAVTDIEGIFRSAHTPDGSAVESWSITACEKRLPAIVVRQGQHIGQAIRDITEEKGFAWTGATLTVAEHDNIGSTVSGLYREMAMDVPVNLIERRIREQTGLAHETGGLLEPEHIDKSRRLSGKTRLNMTTWQVTDEVDHLAQADSYYFLNDKRKVEVKAEEAKLIQGLTDLYDKAASLAKASFTLLPILKGYGLGQVTGDELRQALYLYIEGPGIDVQMDHRLNELKQQATEAGVFDPLLTPQEITTRAGVTVDAKYLHEPYTPIAIQEGWMTIQEVRAKRQREGWIKQTTNLFEYEMPFCFELADLDGEGKTVNGPRFLVETEERMVAEDDKFREFIKSRVTFPFARPDDWYYKGPEST